MLYSLLKVAKGMPGTSSPFNMKKRLSPNASTAHTYLLSLQKSITTSLKNEYQYIKNICKSITSDKINQQNMFVTLIDTRFLSLRDAY